MILRREGYLGEVTKLQALVKEYFNKRTDIIQQMLSGGGLENSFFPGKALIYHLEAKLIE